MRPSLRCHRAVEKWCAVANAGFKGAQFLRRTRPAPKARAPAAACSACIARTTNRSHVWAAEEESPSLRPPVDGDPPGVAGLNACSKALKVACVADGWHGGCTTTSGTRTQHRTPRTPMHEKAPPHRGPERLWKTPPALNSALNVRFNKFFRFLLLFVSSQTRVRGLGGQTWS